MYIFNKNYVTDFLANVFPRRNHFLVHFKSNFRGANIFWEICDLPRTPRRYATGSAEVNT